MNNKIIIDKSEKSREFRIMKSKFFKLLLEIFVMMVDKKRLQSEVTPRSQKDKEKGIVLSLRL